LINSALGFDSYLVSRQDQSSACYFCSDIVSAANSRQKRPLDEQCTVTRPGLSFVAGGLCGELMVALIHSNSSEQYIPYQIRGYLEGFSQMTIEVCLSPCSLDASCTRFSH
jgi:ubiquitin-like modifier-activating enzyme ATG7